MADIIDDLDPKVNNDTPPPKADDNDSDLVKRLVAEQINESLKPIKEKLNGAYEARDNALKRIAEFEAKERAAELQRLQEEGKHKEAFEMQLAEERAKRETAEKRNVELTRDLEVKNSLVGVDFRNDKAGEMAYREVVGQLVQNEAGQWVHRSGVSVRDFVKSYVDDENNAFLLKPKASSGSGSSAVKPNNSGSNEKKSLFSMSQDEVLKMAREGKLRR